MKPPAEFSSEPSNWRGGWHSPPSNALFPELAEMKRKQKAALLRDVLASGTGTGHAFSQLLRSAEAYGQHCYDEEQRINATLDLDNVPPFRDPDQPTRKELRDYYLEYKAMQSIHEAREIVTYRYDIIIYGRVALDLLFRGVVFAAALVILWPYIRSYL